MVCFHDAVKISTVPFPFPYAQTCDVLLILHWLIVPFIVTQFVNKAVWGAIFAFVQVFTLWALNFIAVELENPYGQDANDIDGRSMQDEFNQQLLMLVHPDARRVPALVRRAEDLLSLAPLSTYESGGSESVCTHDDIPKTPKLRRTASRLSFSEAWINLDRQMLEEKQSIVQGSASISSFASYAGKRSRGDEGDTTLPQDGGGWYDDLDTPDVSQTQLAHIRQSLGIAECILEDEHDVDEEAKLQQPKVHKDSASPGGPMCIDFQASSCDRDSSHRAGTAEADLAPASGPKLQCNDVFGGRLPEAQDVRLPVGIGHQ
mmetsp:Transcript_137313/g.238713  ORF Transcript_137313/g.238713 Transcript_137313/m.238713 type:complete len:318 (-) Transcript_137313:100-1053(-)